jgi:hypothetical protein
MPVFGVGQELAGEGHSRRERNECQPMVLHGCMERGLRDGRGDAGELVEVKTKGIPWS